MNKDLKAQIAGIICVFMWGSGMPFTRLIGDRIDAYSLVFIRSFLSALVLVGIALLTTGLRKPFKKSHYLMFFVFGLVNFSLYTVFYNLGLQTLESAPASVIAATTPIFAAIALQFIYDERIRTIGWISITAAFFGVVIMLMWKGTMNLTIGVLWMFLNAMANAFFSISSRKTAELGYTPLESVTYQQIAAAIQMSIFLPQAISCISTAGLTANLAVLYLAIFPNGLACWLWVKAVGDADKTSRVTNCVFFMPVAAALIGYLVMGEVPGVNTLVGGIIIILSVVIFSTYGLQKDEHL